MTNAYCFVTNNWFQVTITSLNYKWILLHCNCILFHYKSILLPYKFLLHADNCILHFDIRNRMRITCVCIHSSSKSLLNRLWELNQIETWISTRRTKQALGKKKLVKYVVSIRNIAFIGNREPETSVLSVFSR